MKNDNIFSMLKVLGINCILILGISGNKALAATLVARYFHENWTKTPFTSNANTKLQQMMDHFPDVVPCTEGYCPDFVKHICGKVDTHGLSELVRAKSFV